MTVGRERSFAPVAARVRSGARRGMTLIELVLAVGLASILMLAVFRLLDTSLSLWSRGEVRRAALEQASATVELLARDLRSLHAGVQADLVAEWVAFDADRDGAKERFWPRIVLVRHASPAELDRVPVGDGAGEAPAGTGTPRAALRGGLVEVAWVVLPGREDPAEGVLWRGERRLLDPASPSFFSDGYFDGQGRAPVGALHEVTGGLLWFGLAFATQTSLVHDGWSIGPGLPDASGSWDAWKRERPDALAHAWNEPGAGMPALGGVALLPRRVRVELEFERPVDRKRRTETLDELDATQTSFRVGNPKHLPGGLETFVLVDAEWMKLVGVDGDRVKVARGQRGTAPRPHAPGALVHHGVRVVSEIPIGMVDESWNL